MRSCTWSMPTLVVVPAWNYVSSVLVRIGLEVPIKSVFSSAEELDAYLDAMQKKVSDDNDYL